MKISVSVTTQDRVVGGLENSLSIHGPQSLINSAAYADLDSEIEAGALRSNFKKYIIRKLVIIIW